MTALMVRVSDKNKEFVLYNHLFSKKTPFTIAEIRQELKDNYGLDVTETFLKYKFRDYLDCGLLVHEFDKYIWYSKLYTD